jgi:hypothetical protein
MTILRMITIRIPILGVAAIPDTRRNNYVLWTRGNLERVAHGWLGYAGLIHADTYRNCCMVIPTTSAVTDHADSKMPKMFRQYSSSIFPMPSLRRIAQAQLLELQPGD